MWTILRRSNAAITDFTHEPNGGLIVSGGAQAVLHRELIVMLAAQRPPT